MSQYCNQLPRHCDLWFPGSFRVFQTCGESYHRIFATRMICSATHGLHRIQILQSGLSSFDSTFVALWIGQECRNAFTVRKRHRRYIPDRVKKVYQSGLLPQCALNVTTTSCHVNRQQLPLAHSLTARRT